MRRPYQLALCVVCLLVTVSSARPALADSPDTSKSPGRGIAVLASSVGSDFSPEALAEFVQRGKISLVVVDWAWITYHWEKTDFAAVNRFLDLMAKQKVPVAAMYRPRFLSKPTVATQMTQEGERSVDHAEICYSDASARKWGVAWGEKILEKCPSFRDIIIYNPTNSCRCPACTTAGSKGPYSAVVGFLSEARSAWRAKQPDVKLGAVYMPVADFWKAALSTIDVAHPYLRVREEIDPVAEVADVRAVRSIAKEKMGSCLAKVTWEEGARVAVGKLKTIADLAGKDGISYFAWTFDTLFASSVCDPKAAAEALGMDPSAIDAIGKPASRPALPTAPMTQANTPTELEYTAEQIKSTSAETFLERLSQPEPGYSRFSALHALGRKAKEADPEARKAILDLVIKAMKDKSRNEYQRFQCCYVISESQDERGVPDLTEVLLKDESDTMRSVAAEALAGFPNSKAAHDALLQAARKDNSPMVQEVLKRRLGQEMPALDPGVTPAVGKAVEEMAPSGPPKPPDGPKRPMPQPLPWPFPGDQKAQNIFNNYQQATDDYIHCGLDFLHPVGTPVTAVGPGYVAAMWSREPHTHDYFIVTPVKGGNRGWCYTHMDPKTYTFKEGDAVKQGQLLGSLVNFSVNGQPGEPHLHLHYVSFTREPDGRVPIHSVMDPLYFFDYKDTEPPTFRPLWLVPEGSTKPFQADASGVVTVSGKVDIVAAVTDSAYPGQMGNLGVPVVMLSISDGKHTMRKLVVDHRGDVGDERQTRPLHLGYEEKKAFVNPNSFPRYQVLRVTKTDGDGKITPADFGQCWDTTATDSAGRPTWPNGRYSVNVYAWDIAGNRGAAGAMVEVKN